MVLHFSEFTDPFLAIFKDNTKCKMRVIILLPVVLLALVMVLVESKTDKEKEKDSEDYTIENQGSGRVFPLLPPYQGVDFAANFNKLKSSGDAGYFVVRDSIVVSYGDNTKGANMSRKTKSEIVLPQSST